MTNIHSKNNTFDGPLGNSRNEKERTLNALTSDSMSGGGSPDSKNRNVIIMKNNRSIKSIDKT